MPQYEVELNYDNFVDIWPGFYSTDADFVLTNNNNWRKIVHANTGVHSIQSAFRGWKHVH